jgi:hypothetical protein
MSPDWLTNLVTGLSIKSMRGSKQKAVINAETSQLARIQQLINGGRYQTLPLLQSVWVDSKHCEHGDGAVDGEGGELATS